MKLNNQAINIVKPLYRTMMESSPSKTSFCSSINSDIFEKRTNFKPDYSYEAFKKWADETGFASKAEDVVEKSGKLLGRGFEGSVFEIPDCDNWVIKLYNRAKYIRNPIKEPEFIKTDDILPDLNIGQPVGILNIPAGENYSRKCWILKKQKGKQLGVSINIDRHSENILNNSYVARHINSLQKLSDAPQSTFDKFVNDVNYINSNGLFIDCGNENNFLFDDENQSINFVDIIDRYNGEKQFSEALYAISGGKFGLYYNWFCPECPQKDEACKMSKIIIKKYCNAMKNNNFQFNEHDEIFDLLNASFSNPNTADKNKSKFIEILKQHNLYA